VGDVRVGVVRVNPDGKMLGAAGHAPIALHDLTAHAEIRASRMAGAGTENYRRPGHPLYVTLEPCTMCASAIANARIDRIVYAASDLKGGAVESGVQFFNAPTCHHRPEVTSGMGAETAAQMLRDFFRARRK